MPLERPGDPRYEHDIAQGIAQGIAQDTTQGVAQNGTDGLPLQVRCVNSNESLSLSARRRRTCDTGQ
jgi:hypothetical protein